MQFKKIMKEKLRFFKDIDFEGKVVFLRMDYNVPIQNDNILDHFKLNASFSTIIDTYKKKPKQIIIGTHLGRPNGKYDKELSCKPIYEAIKIMIHDNFNENVYFSSDLNFKNEKFIFIENLRFFPEEENISSKSNNLILFFKNKIDIIINDAFGVLHRYCYSTTNDDLPIFSGNLIQKETNIGYEILNEGVDLLILGGCKIKDKLKILETLIPRCKSVFIVGAIACTFLKYHYNKQMGFSKVEEDAKEEVEKILCLSKKFNVSVHTSQDFVIDQNQNILYDSEFPYDGKVMDIGPKTIKKLETIIKLFKNIFWNGPPGKFEEKEYSKGSKKLAEMLSIHNGKVVVGGGETSACVCKYSKITNFYHVSTGGGSFLKLLSRSKLPGLEKLKE